VQLSRYLFQKTTWMTCERWENYSEREVRV
jgi:hypothetical protein